MPVGSLLSSSILWFDVMLDASSHCQHTAHYLQLVLHRTASHRACLRSREQARPEGARLAVSLGPSPLSSFRFAPSLRSRCPLRFLSLLSSPPALSACLVLFSIRLQCARVRAVLASRVSRRRLVVSSPLLFSPSHSRPCPVLSRCPRRQPHPILIGTSPVTPGHLAL